MHLGYSTFKNKSVTSINNQEIISSTPIITKTLLNFENNSSQISPIRTPMKNEDHILSTDPFYDLHILNMQRIMQNDIYQNNQQLSADMLEISGFDFLNTSQNTNITKDSNNTLESIYYSSRDFKYIQTESVNSKSEINYLSNTNKISLRTETKDNTNNNISSVYFNDLKKIKNIENKYENSSNSSQDKNSILVSKQNLSKKLKNNESCKHLNQNSLIKKLKRIERNNELTHLESSMSSISESWARLKLSFSDISFSDLDKSIETPIKMKNSRWTNKIEQNSIKLECNDSWEQNMNNLNMDIDSQNYSEDNISADSSPKVSNPSNQDKNNKYNMKFSTSHISSLIFSDDSILCTNSINNNSHQFDSIKQEFVKWSQDSFDASDYEENVNILLSNNINIVSYYTYLIIVNNQI